jgi:hypothetical protein
MRIKLQIVAPPGAAVILMPMNPSPLTRRDKAVAAIVLWLFVSLISLPLWAFALALVECLRLPGALLAPHECLLGAPVMMIFHFFMRKEDGTDAMFWHYAPAIVIGSAFTAWVLRRWWRRS